MNLVTFAVTFAVAFALGFAGMLFRHRIDRLWRRLRAKHQAVSGDFWGRL